MKNPTKDNRGITLLMLIITIIIMLILVSVVTYVGVDTYKEAKVYKFVTQMQLIQKKVDELAEEKSIEELRLLGESASNKATILNQAYTNNEVSDNNTDSYRYFSKNALLNEFNLEDIDDGIIVNFTTKEVVSINGIEYNGMKHFTQYNLPNGQKIVQHRSYGILRNLNFISNITIDGLNASITISNVSISNGKLDYKEENENYWTTITNYTETEKEYKINISKSGTYEIKLVDNTEPTLYSYSNMVQIELINKPKLNENMILLNNNLNYVGNSPQWAYAQNTANSIYYLWIPRLAYKTDENTNITTIKFLKGTSKIATDNTYIDEMEWTIPTIFTTSNGNEVTGVWRSTNYPNTSGTNLIDIINDNTRTNLTIN